MRHIEGWSIHEIETLKCGFVNGESFKRLSEKLGRSITAVNKALSRFQIRPARNSLQKKSKQSLHRIPRKTAAKIHERRTTPLSSPKLLEITPHELLFYLRNCGYSITERSHIVNTQPGVRYMLNQRPLTLIQLLVKANGIRLDEGKPIFVLKKEEEEF